MSTVTPFLNLVKPAPLEGFSRATYNNNLDLIDAHALGTEKYAKGLLQAPIKVNTPSGGVTDAIINNIPTFTFKGGRKYRIVWDASYSQTVTSDIFLFQIASAATTDAAGLTTGLTILGERKKGVLAGANLVQHNGAVTAYYNPAGDATVQLKFRILRASGSGTLVVHGAVNEEATYTIYDDGAQF